MTDNNIRIKILEGYKEVFPSRNNQSEWVIYYIEKYKIDPFNQKTITNAINKLKKKQKKIETPELIEIKRELTPRKSKRTGEISYRPEYVNYYKGMKTKEGDKIMTKVNSIERDIKILGNMQDITKLFSLGVSKLEENKQQENIEEIKKLLNKADKNTKQNVANLRNDINNLSKKVSTAIKDTKQGVANMLNDINNSFTKESQSNPPQENNKEKDMIILKVITSKRPKDILYILATYLSISENLKFKNALYAVNQEEMLLEPNKIKDNDYSKWRTNNKNTVDEIIEYINKNSK